jgi:acyl carrier protein
VDGPVAGGAPLGRPLAGVRLYVLDPRERLVPACIPGELVIGGAGVSRGYLGQPAQTAAAFLPDPFSGEPGARMYRSGDRVRWSASGELVFMGRLDAQLKVRGFRIEPAEVEAVLAGHRGVAAAAVAVRRDPAGDAFLAAWVVGNGEAPPAAELRAWLRERLPEYMVPSLFTPLEALPLTPRGKVDRRALPEPRPDEAEEGEEVAPRDAVEDAVAEIWAEVLGRGPIGVTRSFFELGGHSLSATQVLVRIRDAFEVDLPIRTFFTDPTVAGLSAAIRAAGSPVLDAMMAELEDLSDEEIAALLGEE